MINLICFNYIAFTPLWVTLIIKDIISIVNNNENLYTEYISIFIISLIFILCLVIVYKKINKSEHYEEYYIKDMKRIKNDITEFILTYTLPLFAFQFEIWYEFILFLIFFLTIFLLNIKYNNYCPNIILELLNYRTYECTLKISINSTEKIEKCKVILPKTKENEEGKFIKLKSINNEYKILNKDIKNGSKSIVGVEKL